MDNCNIILCHSQASIHFKQSNSPSEQAHSDKGSQAFRVGVVGAQRLEVYGIGFLVVLLCQPLVASFTMNNSNILFGGCNRHMSSSEGFCLDIQRFQRVFVVALLKLEKHVSNVLLRGCNAHTCEGPRAASRTGSAMLY